MGVGVDVAVGFAVMGVDVDVVEAAAPADEEPRCQQHYDAPDGDLGDLVDELGQELVQEYERGPVPQAPKEAHHARLPYPVSLLLGGDEGCDGGKVVGVARVSQTEQQADEQDDPDAGLSVQKPFEPAVYRAHALLLASVFQRGSHQPAVMLPGEIQVVDLFGRDPAYLGHVVRRARLAVNYTRQKADG